MKKMLALYRAPEDAEEFLRHYREVHMPLVRALPGLVDAAITRINRTLVGEAGVFLMAEMSFADDAALAAALSERGLQRVHEHFCWSVCARQMVDQYRSRIDVC